MDGRAVTDDGAVPTPLDGPAHRYKKMFDRCSALARIGVWECDLATEALTWTDGVYDLFDIPRGSIVTRAMTKALYDEASCREMERLRARAIAERGSFTLDIAVTTAKGEARWIRLTADVECAGDGRSEPVRIFGLKQDITREKELLDRLQRLAERDPLTGLANRAVFDASLAAAARAPTGEPALAAVLLLDVDRFKQVNDTFGHASGDECLRRVAEILPGAFPPGSLAARLGGDEFAVLLYGAQTPASVSLAVAGLVDRCRRSILRDGRRVAVSVSVGVAMAGDCDGVGWAERLVRHADVALYAAKHAGRDTFRLFEAETGAVPDGCVDAERGARRALA